MFAQSRLSLPRPELRPLHAAIVADAKVIEAYLGHGAAQRLTRHLGTGDAHA